VVDVLARFRSQAGRNQQLYDADYLAIAGLQAIASEKNVAVVVVHHLRKSGSDSDPFDKVSGTLGLSGAADSVLIIDREAAGTTLYVRGRDVEEAELAVQFDKATCKWQVLGTASDVRKSDERKDVIKALQESPMPMSPSDIARATGKSPDNVRQLLFKMVREGDVIRTAGGGYVVNPRNGDNAITGSAPPLPPRH
jgi:hypothetical protein